MNDNELNKRDLIKFNKSVSIDVILFVFFILYLVYPIGGNYVIR